MNDQPMCKAKVSRTFGPEQCYAAVKRDGYCGIHHPDAVAARKAKSDALWKRQDDMRLRRREAEDELARNAERWIKVAPHMPQAIKCLRSAEWRALADLIEEAIK